MYFLTHKSHKVTRERAVNTGKCNHTRSKRATGKARAFPRIPEVVWKPLDQVIPVNSQGNAELGGDGDRRWMDWRQGAGLVVQASTVSILPSWV